MSYARTSGEVYIIAKELAERVAKAAGIESYEIIATLPGSELELMETYHPFLDRLSTVLCGEHVTLDAGTGCVHTAPGHGAEDFDICKYYDDNVMDKIGHAKLGVVVPVDSKGNMTAEAGKYAGLRFNKASDAILADLKESGALLASETIVHQYPHCWRCRIRYLRATGSGLRMFRCSRSGGKRCEDIRGCRSGAASA